MYRRILLLLALAIPIAACEDASAPNGNDSTVLVRAYVDANGSGVFDAGDVPISDAAVTLRSNTTGAVLNATTDAAGLATFASVEPGSYSAARGGTAPAGALLATAGTPTVVAPFEGGEVSGEFRFVYVPGSLAGVLFRDNNGNGVFDAGIDTPAPGMVIDLFEGATAAGTAIGQTVTTSAGAFSFGPLRPGSYTLVIHPLPTMSIVGGDTVTVTVGPDVNAPIALTFTGNLISTIGEVRDTAFADSAGTRFDVVAVEGVVHTAQGTFRTDNAFIQDATGGMLLFNVPATAGLEIGDSIRVIAAIDWFNGELELARISSTAPPVIEHLGTAAIPQPRVISGTQMLSRDYEGQLVQLTNAVVDSVGTPSSSGGYTVWVISGDGERLQVRIENSSIGIDPASWVIDGRYDIAGALSHFRGVPQLKPRSAADVAGGSTATPIGDVRALAFADSAGTRGDTVTIEGVVHTGLGVFGATSAYIQDPTGGVLLFGVDTANVDLQIGDSVRVTGTLAWFSGELEVVGSSGSPMIVESLGTGATPAPRTISGAQFLSRAYEGQLVRLGSVVVDSIGSVSGSGGYTVWVITTDDERLQVRVNSTAIGIPVGTWTVGGTYDVVGALARFGGHTTQLKPRSAADVTAGDPDVISIAAAEQLPNADTVIIEGVVTAPVGPFGTLNAYLQDGTGGIQIFGVDTAAVDLEIGDLIRVRGVMGTFNNERQVARFSSTAPLQITVLGDAAVPAPRPVSGAEVLARTYEGELVALDSVTVVSVGTVSGSGGYNVTVQTADGSQVVLRNDRAAVGVPSTFWTVGSVYDVVGIASNFFSSGVDTPQVKFRGTFDVAAR